jgi:hypothetical protein
LLRTQAIDGTATQPELAARVVQQLIELAMAHAIMDDRREVDESDLELIRRVVIDTMPIARRRIMYKLCGRGGHILAMGKRQLISLAHTDEKAVDDILTQYLHTNVLFSSSGPDEAPFYSPTPELYKAVDECKLFSGDHVVSTD